MVVDDTQQVLPKLIWEKCVALVQLWKKCPIAYIMGRPKFTPKTAPSRLHRRRSPPHLIHLSLDLPHWPPQMASGSTQPFCHSTLSGLVRGTAKRQSTVVTANTRQWHIAHFASYSLQSGLVESRRRRCLEYNITKRTQRRIEPRLWATYTENFVKFEPRVFEISVSADTHSDKQLW